MSTSTNNPMTTFMSGWTHWFKFALQNTLRNRRRSLVTVSIAALGTAAILLAGGFALFTYQALAQAAAGSSHDRGPPAQFERDGRAAAAWLDKADAGRC
jgi:putative ABC transport system permease protein